MTDPDTMNFIPRALRSTVLLLIALAPALPAFAQYQPSYTVLRSTQHVHVNRDGSNTDDISSLLRIDTPKGIELLGEQRLSYVGSLETMEVVEAWTLTPDGQRIDVPASGIRTMEESDSGSPQFSDGKVLVIIFPAVRVGSQTFWRARSVQHTPYFPGNFFWSRFFSPQVVQQDTRLTITHDPAIALSIEASGMTGGAVAALASDAPGTVRHEYAFKQDTAFPPEPGRLPLTDFAPHVLVTSFKSWGELGLAYQARARPQAEPTEAITRLATELTAGKTTPRDKVRVLHQWVSRNIRYVSMDIGAGGFVPHSAQSILDNRYGDCKDHVALLEALLRSVGIESSPALINYGDAVRLPKLPVSSPINHVITYIPSLDLYLDSTSQFAPMGTLPDGDLDKPVLLTATGEVGRTPAMHPQREFIHSQAWLTLSKTGEVSGRSVTRYGGSHEIDSRGARFDHQGREVSQIVDGLLARFDETGTGNIEQPDPLDLTVPWEVKSSFELDPVVNMPGPAAMTMPVGLVPGVIPSMRTFKAFPERRFEFYCGSHGYREETEIAFPASTRIDRIPPNVRFSRGALRYLAQYQRRGQSLHVVREYTAHRQGLACNATNDADWAALLPVLQRDLRGQVFFR